MKRLPLTVILCAGFLSASIARADQFGGVEFPGGISSFADAVVAYDPNVNSFGEPTEPFRDTSQALGAPDYIPSEDNLAYVSLGDGGSITLRFTDNSLTGSGNSNFDLWIFEIGPDVEDTFVEISKNGSDWTSVGKVYGSTSGIDIDAYGFGYGDFFSYVRLTDDGNEGAQRGVTVGADIDAVGAISSAPPVQVPDVAAMMQLLVLASLGLLSVRRTRNS